MARIKVADWITDEGLLQLYDWAREGYTDKEIYQALHISKTTFYRWENEYPQIEQTIRKGRAPVIVDIEHSFLNSCKDRVVTEETIYTTNEGFESKKTTKRFLPGRYSAQMYYLKTHYPERWGEPVTDAQMMEMELTIKRLEKDLEMKDLQLQKMRKELEHSDDEMSKVDLLLEEITNEAIEDAE